MLVQDRLRILRNLKEGSAFYDTKAGKRLLASVREKLSWEGVTEHDFRAQKLNKWRLQGKSFFDIFGEVQNEDLYAATYGMMSESIHGSWHETMDWCLHRNDDGTFSTNPFSYPADIRHISPMLRFTTPPYRQWLQRIDCYNDNLKNTFDWIERANAALFRKFDAAYDG